MIWVQLGILIRLVLSRAAAAPGLLVIRIMGTFLAVILVTGVSLYSSAVGDAMLQTQLARDQYDTSHIGIAYEALGEGVPPLNSTTYATLDHYVHDRMQGDLGLPLSSLYVHHFIAQVPLYRTLAARAQPSGSLLAALPLEYYQGLSSQVVLVQGSFGPPTGTSKAAMPVVVSLATAQALHLAVGDHLIGATSRHKILTPPLVITGLYVQKDPKSDFWNINTAQPFTQSLILTRLDDFVQLAAGSTQFSPTYFWRYTISLGAVHLDDATALLNRMQRVGSKISLIASGTQLHTLLDQDINGFLYTYALLPVALYVLVTPIVLLVLYAIAVTTALVLDRQAGEIVLMRSRGATLLQVFTIYLVEGLLIGGCAMVCGLLLGLPIARLIGQSSGFLHFGGGLPIALRVGPVTVFYAGITAFLALLASLLPALSLTRRTMAHYKQDLARQSGSPLWQRLYLDVVLLVVALYGYSVLTKQGQITSSADMAAMAQDPLIGLTPLAFAVALALVLSRIVPYLATLSVYAGSRLASPAVQLALQFIARAPRQPMRLVQLLSLTLSLGVFAATVAGVEERNVADQQIYDAGTTVRLVEQRYGVVPGKFVPLTMPVAWHLALPGVEAASPVMRYRVLGDSINTTDSGVTVNVLGIDPASAAVGSSGFGRILPASRWRHSWATWPTLALTAIVSQTFFDQDWLAQGRHIQRQFIRWHRPCMPLSRQWLPISPVLDPGDNGAPFVIVNLPYLIAAAHLHGPNEMWIKAANNQSTRGSHCGGSSCATSRRWAVSWTILVSLPPFRQATTHCRQVSMAWSPWAS